MKAGTHLQPSTKFFETTKPRYVDLVVVWAANKTFSINITHFWTFPTFPKIMVTTSQPADIPDAPSDIVEVVSDMTLASDDGDPFQDPDHTIKTSDDSSSSEKMATMIQPVNGCIAARSGEAMSALTLTGDSAARSYPQTTASTKATSMPHLSKMWIFLSTPTPALAIRHSGFSTFRRIFDCGSTISTLAIMGTRSR